MKNTQEYVVLFSTLLRMKYNSRTKSHKNTKKWMIDQISKGPKTKKKKKKVTFYHHVNIAVQRLKVFSNSDTIKWLSHESIVYSHPN